jgi:hypothetical protein
LDKHKHPPSNPRDLDELLYKIRRREKNINLQDNIWDSVELEEEDKMSQVLEVEVLTGLDKGWRLLLILDMM